MVIPALVANRDDFDRLLVQLELHYLSTPDPSLAFALLTDHVDSPQRPDDQAILAHAEEVVRLLNAKYASAPPGPFHVLHRDAQWNAAEGCFMGWERKRGKLEELNRLLRGDETTSFTRHFGDPIGLVGIRFVITLDADTQLAVGCGAELVGLARASAQLGAVRSAHRADRVGLHGRPAAGRDVARRTARPRCSAASGAEIGLDIYTHAVSDVYQDLFGSGIYVGKGYLRDRCVHAERPGASPRERARQPRSVRGHSRPRGARDRYRPVRGLSAAVPVLRASHAPLDPRGLAAPSMASAARGVLGPAGVCPNRLSAIDRWKIVDNLRRSLLAPSLLALFFFGLASGRTAWVLAPLWISLAVLVPTGAGAPWREALGRWSLGVVFLSHEAWVASDAIVRAVVRVTITRKHLLQWVTAAETARAFAHGSRRVFWREMGPAAVLTTCLGAALGAWHPAVWPVAAPFLLLWLLSPEVARWISTPASSRGLSFRPIGGSCATLRAERGCSSKRSWVRGTSGSPPTTSSKIRAASWLIVRLRRTSA